MDLSTHGIRAHVNYEMEDQREGKSVLTLQKKIISLIAVFFKFSCRKYPNTL